MSNGVIDNTERVLLKLLACALSGDTGCTIEFGADTDWEKIISMAKSHAVIALIADIMLADGAISESLTKEQKTEISRCCEGTLINDHKLLYLTDKYLKILENAGITGVVLKGWAVSGYYHVPELRKTGDIDIIVANNDVGKAIEALKNDGFREVDGQHSNHHTELIGEDKVIVEIHNTLVELFDNDMVNSQIKEYGQNMLTHYEIFEYNGYRIRRAVPEYNAISLALHMLQHYMRAGFGLKLLCDWVEFVNDGIDANQYKAFIHMADTLGITGFVTMINSVCHEYFGMRIPYGEKIIQNKETIDAFTKDLIDGEEFGRSDSRRMVVVNGSGLYVYAKEFHHQMILNNPGLSKKIILWPYLWIKTLVVFIRNNRTIRKTKTMDIIKNAGLRGRMIKEMRIFKNNQ